MRSERAKTAWATSPNLIAIRTRAAEKERPPRTRPKPSAEDLAKAEKFIPPDITEGEETRTQRFRRKKSGLTFEGWLKKSRERWRYYFAKEIMRQRMLKELEFDTTRTA